MSRTTSWVTHLGLFSQNTNPRASAPASTAVNASSTFVMPQILTQVTEPAFSSQPSAINLRQESPQRLSRRYSLHQRLANQKCLVACSPQTRDVFSVLDSTLGHAQHVLWHQASQTQRGIQIDGEGSQVAAIHSDQVTTGSDGAFQFLLVVNFTKHVEAVVFCLLRQNFQFYL